MNDERMGNKKILPLLIEFSVPAIIGMLVNAIYNVVDRMFIGNAPQLGAVGIAGITISYPVTLVLMAISLMVGVGGATRFSISLGQKEKDKASIYQGNAIVLTAVFGYVYEGIEVVDKIATTVPVTDNNGTVEASNQPVITSIKMLK